MSLTNTTFHIHDTLNKYMIPTSVYYCQDVVYFMLAVVSVVMLAKNKSSMVFGKYCPGYLVKLKPFGSSDRKYCSGKYWREWGSVK